MSDRDRRAVGDLQGAIATAAILATVAVLTLYLATRDLDRLRARMRTLAGRAEEADELAETRRLQLDGALEELHATKQQLADAKRTKPTTRRSPAKRPSSAPETS